MSFWHKLRQSWPLWLVVSGLVLLVALPRLTALNHYVIVDEADRWRWAENFIYALHDGDLAATLVGDGYPGIVPVWAESVWIFLEAGRRSLVEGQWVGQAGLYQIFHQWDRPEFLDQQRLPIVLLNTAIALTIIWAVWRLFGPRVALVGGLLIALDPFYLSDSRVNRAEAVITGLMTLSMLWLIFFYRERRLRYVILSGIFGGLSLLTKIQALAIAPAIAVTGFLIYLTPDESQTNADDTKKTFSLAPNPYPLIPILKFGLIWIAAAGLTWFLLWPSMWVTPLETLTLVYNYTTRKVGAEGVSLFFLGQTYVDSDPGLLFYPVVFFLRTTPLVLLGLLGAAFRFTLHALRRPPLAADPFRAGGTAILLVYVAVYALVMSFGSHKQDRYLMPIFLSLDILAALGLVYLWVWLKSKIFNGQLHSEPARAGQTRSISNLPISNLHLVEWPLLATLLIIQLLTVYPHHPYYYSYFNPLLGGGQTAVNSLRIGWGEGMDQVGRYLAAKPDSRELIVTSRFTHNMPDFKGELISLTPSGRWTRADYVVLYIQQVQRGIDPNPDFIDYFRARQPEKIITIGDIDYAWIYPIPFSVPADPTVSFLPEQMALLGYRWAENEGAASQLRLFWRNLGLADDRRVAIRLVSGQAETAWAACSPAPDFADDAQTVGRYVESLCHPTIGDLPPGLYSVEVGLTAGHDDQIEKLLFPEGWQAARLTTAGLLRDTTERERFEAIAAETIPAAAHRVDRVYDERLRLAAYRLDPASPTPSTSLTLTLYWQPVREMHRPLDVTVQLADSRLLSLGRSDANLFTPAEDERETEWLPGNIIEDHYDFQLPAEMGGPLAAQLEVTLLDTRQVPLRATTLEGVVLDQVVDRFTIAPEVWPTLSNVERVTAAWQNGPVLHGYRLPPEPWQPGQTVPVTLFWDTAQPITENYVVFVHLVDEAGQLQTQNDSLPRAGAYPTLWWQPDQVVEDTHFISLPADLSDGEYTWLIGLYRQSDGVRLLLVNGEDHFKLRTDERP